MRKITASSLEKLNSACFEILGTISDSPDVSILSLLVDKLEDILDVSGVSIRIRRPGNKKFVQTFGYTPASSQRLIDAAEEAICTNTIHWIRHDPEDKRDTEIAIIPVLPNDSLEVVMSLFPCVEQKAGKARFYSLKIRWRPFLVCCKIGTLKKQRIQEINFYYK